MFYYFASTRLYAEPQIYSCSFIFGWKPEITGGFVTIYNHLHAISTRLSHGGHGFVSSESSIAKENRNKMYRNHFVCSSALRLNGCLKQFSNRPNCKLKARSFSHTNRNARFTTKCTCTRSLSLIENLCHKYFNFLIRSNFSVQRIAMNANVKLKFFCCCMQYAT